MLEKANFRTMFPYIVLLCGGIFWVSTSAQTIACHPGTQPLQTIALTSDASLTNGSVGNLTLRQSTDYCSGAPQLRSVFYLTFLVVVMVVAFVGNVVVVVGIACSNTLRVRPTNYFVMSLAVSDIAVCVFVMPVRVASSYHNQAFCLGGALCVFHVITDVVVHVASVTNLLLIAIDRYCAVVHPYKYSHYLCSGNALKLVGLAWGYAFMWGFFSVFSWHKPRLISSRIYHAPQPKCINHNPFYYTSIYLMVYVVPLFLMGVMYVRVLRIAVKQARAIAALEINDTGNTENSSRWKQRRVKSEMKATKTVMIVYGTFLICWLPICIITIYSNWCTSCWLSFRRNHEVLFYVIFLILTDLLPPLNSTLNPFIYALFGRQFRSAFKSLLMRMLGRTHRVNNVADDATITDRSRRITLVRIFRKSSSTVAALAR